MRDLETRHYKLAVGTGAGAGTFIIIRTRDNATTLRNTGSEAEEQFKKLEREYNIAGQCFDDECEEMEYTQ